MPKTVLITGASGFIGTAVTARFLAGGYRVRALARGPHPSETDAQPGLEWAQGDMRDLPSLKAAMKGVDVVLHLAAAKSDERNSEEINVGGARNLVEAMKTQPGIELINLSTQSAKLSRRGTYGETKRKADEVFAASGIPTTTLHASVVYGDKESGVIGSLVRFSHLPVVPVIGSGDIHFWPIHRDDVAEVIMKFTERPQTRGKSFDVGGPESVTFNEMLGRVMTMENSHAPILHLPLWLAMMMAKLMRVLPHPPITISNVLGSAEDRTMNVEPFFAAINWKPRPFSEGLPIPSESEREAALLLSYVLSDSGVKETPSTELINRYLAALRAHHIYTEPTLLGHALSSRGLLRKLDVASRTRARHSTLQKKLLIAAAIVECDPVSAKALLPRNMGKVMWMLRVTGVLLGVAATTLLALLYLIAPSLLRRHVRD